jgi:hypothetical protein
MAAVALAAAVPVGARAGVPVALYPVQAEGLTEGERSEVQAVVESALVAADRRGVLEPRSPLVTPANCKAPITVGCVATLAKGGVVLYAKAKRRGAQILVTVLFVDAVGRKTRAAAFPIDLFIQNLRPANDAIATIEAELASGALEDSTPPPPPARAQAEKPKPAERPPTSPTRPPDRTPPAEKPAADAAEATPAPPPKVEPKPPPEAKPEPAVAEPAAPERPAHHPPPEPEPEKSPETPAEPVIASAPIDQPIAPKVEAPKPGRQPLRPAPEPPAPGTGNWKRTMGRWSTGAGVAMLVGGAVVGLTGKQLGDALEDRYASGALRPGDAKLYDRVDLYGRLANGLFLAGGVTTAAGFGFLLLAPAGGGAGIALAGSF